MSATRLSIIVLLSSRWGSTRRRKLVSAVRFFDLLPPRAGAVGAFRGADHRLESRHLPTACSSRRRNSGRWGAHRLLARSGAGGWGSGLLRTPASFSSRSRSHWIVGGAIGNAIDRTAYGAVFDFVHVFFGQLLVVRLQRCGCRPSSRGVVPRSRHMTPSCSRADGARAQLAQTETSQDGRDFAGEWTHQAALPEWKQGYRYEDAFHAEQGLPCTAQAFSPAQCFSRSLSFCAGAGPGRRKAISCVTSSARSGWFLRIDRKSNIVNERLWSCRPPGSFPPPASADGAARGSALADRCERARETAPGGTAGISPAWRGT